MQVTGKCGSVLVRLIPAPRGAGIVAARTPKKVLQMAGIDDVYTAATGSTKTLGNFVKVRFCGWHACLRSLSCYSVSVSLVVRALWLRHFCTMGAAMGWSVPCSYTQVGGHLHQSCSIAAPLGCELGLSRDQAISGIF